MSFDPQAWFAENFGRLPLRSNLIFSQGPPEKKISGGIFASGSRLTFHIPNESSNFGEGRLHVFYSGGPNQTTKAKTTASGSQL